MSALRQDGDNVSAAGGQCDPGHHPDAEGIGRWSRVVLMYCLPEGRQGVRVGGTMMTGVSTSLNCHTADTLGLIRLYSQVQALRVILPSLTPRSSSRTAEDPRAVGPGVFCVRG